jgi:hypothetical protein
MCTAHGGIGSMASSLHPNNTESSSSYEKKTAPIAPWTAGTADSDNDDNDDIYRSQGWAHECI